MEENMSWFNTIKGSKSRWKEIIEFGRKRCPKGSDWCKKCKKCETPAESHKKHGEYIWN